VEFEWDINKAHTNLEKHAVSFDEAQTVFLPITGYSSYRLRSWCQAPSELSAHDR